MVNKHEEAIGELQVARICIKGNPNVVEKEFDLYSDAIDTAIKALEKQIPKKPIDGEFPTNLPDGTVVIKTVCPSCGSELFQWNAYYKICGCGQHIQWGD